MGKLTKLVEFGRLAEIFFEHFGRLLFDLTGAEFATLITTLAKARNEETCKRERLISRGEQEGRSMTSSSRPPPFDSLDQFTNQFSPQLPLVSLSIAFTA
uniref:Uncharacterized protein n=1 Tax=Pristionchus pacificus TaxID=54126 RepID=A0A2A6CUU9_PRIPA|eukprot:PDM81955.1 hypothetical protein PRIPAC_33028 [Pristionchus pacificus]